MTPACGSARHAIFAYVIPNAVWVVVLLLVVRSLGRLLVEGFNAPSVAPR